MDTAIVERRLSRIEQLAQELLDLILDPLPLQCTSRLSRCNKYLRFRLLPVLFGTEERRSCAMKRACEKGIKTSIQCLVSSGASPSIIVMSSPTGSESSFEAKTLYLALKHQRFHTFNLLIELGARIDPLDYTQAQAIITRLFQPHCRATFFDAFLRAGFASHLTQDQRDDMLMRVLGMVTPDFAGDPPSAGWPSLEVVRMLLNSGADPNILCRSTPMTENQGLSPLSAAIFMHRWDLFDLLRQRGADINGVRRAAQCGWGPHPLNLPIMAAVIAMARGKGDFSAEPVQRCLDAGADINICAIAMSPVVAPLYTLTTITLVTPIDVYLYGITVGCWGRGREVKKGVQYLLDHGASLDPVAEMPPVYSDTLRKTPRGDICFGQKRFSVRHPTVRCMLDRWGHMPGVLSQPSFLEAVKLLVRHGGLGGEPGQVWARYDYMEGVGQEVIAAWEDIRAEVMAFLARREDRTRFLYDYISAKGEYPDLGHYPEVGGWWRTLHIMPHIAAMTFATVKYMILAGADINAVVDAPWDKPQTALFRLCDRYANKRYHFYPLDIPRLSPQRGAFLSWLVREAGANPNIRCSYWGKDGAIQCTAAELLRAEMGQLLAEERAPAEELIKVFEEQGEVAYESTDHVAG